MHSRQLICTVGFAVAFAISARAAHAQAIAMESSAFSAVVGDSSGDLLSIGSLVRFGTFGNSTSLGQLQGLASAGNLEALEEPFEQFGEFAVGDTTNEPGLWFASLEGSAIGFSSQRVYLWIFDGPTIDASTEMGIFTNFSSTDWVFPSSDDVPQITLDLFAATDVVFGGINPSFDHPEFGLMPMFTTAAIPEPATYAALLGGATLLIVGFRRFRYRRAA